MEHHIIIYSCGSSDDKVLQWIQARITCCIPEENAKPEMHQLVTKYPTVIVKEKTGWGYFHYRMQVWISVTGVYNSHTIVCGSMHEVVPQKDVHTSSVTRDDDYNPLLLMLWKANMDMQFVSESTLVIAYYVTGT